MRVLLKAKFFAKALAGLSLIASSVASSSAAIQQVAVDYPNDLEKRQLSRSHEAFLKAGINQAQAKILVIGDSISAGALNGSYADARKTSWPVTMAQLLEEGLRRNPTKPLDVTANTFMFSAQTVTDNTRYDPRMKFGLGWQSASYDPNKGSWHVLNNEHSTSNATFTPTSAQCCDTYDLYYYANPEHGLLTTDDSASPNVINENTTAGMTKSTIRFSSPKPLTLAASGNKKVNIQAIHGYMYGRGEITVFNSSINGFGAGNYVYKDRSSQQALLQAIAPDLTIICLGANDMSASVKQYIGNMQNLINAMQISGDIILLTPPPANPETTSDATQAMFVSAMKSLAKKNNIPIVNLWEQWSPWASSKEAGYYYDNIHPNLKGYREISKKMSQFLLPIISEE